MDIKFIKVYVNDQDKALKNYVELLGFKKMADIKMGEKRFLTVEPFESVNKVQIILEKIDNDFTRSFVTNLYASGDPLYSLSTNNIIRDIELLRGKCVKIIDEPSDVGPIICATIDDNCGNLVYLVQNKM